MPATVVTDCGSSRFGLVRVSLLRPPQCLFMARQSAACLSLQAADSERCLFGGDCCHSIRHLCAVPGYMRQTVRRCTVKPRDVIPQTMYRQMLYRQSSDDVPSDLRRCTVRPQTLYRQTSDDAPSELRRCTVRLQTMYRQTSRRCTGVRPQTLYRQTSDADCLIEWQQ